jgi:hypothetical protein
VSTVASGESLPPVTARGGCLCGAVGFTVHGPLGIVTLCHCGQCRRWHGHAAPYTRAETAAVRFERDDGLAWYDSSGSARRGFCRSCGASLFWQRRGGPYLSFTVGCLEAPTGLAIAGHIFVADAGDYYRIADDLPQSPGSGG